MSEQQNLQVIRDAYAAFSRGDIESVLNVLTDDVVWELPGPAQIPYAGVYNGKPEVAQFFSRLAGSEDVQTFEPQQFFANGDMVVVLGRYAARVKANGKTAEADWVHAFTVRAGKIARWHEYLDTATYAKAYEQTPAYS